MFYERFTELCAKNGFSQAAAVQAIGLNRAAISKWKKGSLPQGSTVSKLAELFGVSVDYLLGGPGGSAAAPQPDILDELDVAFLGDYGELTEENKATLRDMARLMLKNQGGGKE